MRPETVGAAWDNGFRGTPWRGPLRKHVRGGASPAASGRRIRLLAAVITLLALLSACGIRPSGVIPGLRAPDGPIEKPSPALYFVQSGQVTSTVRPTGTLTGADVVALLAQGPTDAERSRGLTTEVPTDAAPSTVDRVANGLDVSISTDVSQLSPAAVQQIVCTLLGIQAVGSVNLRGGGHSLEFQRCG